MKISESKRFKNEIDFTKKFTQFFRKKFTLSIIILICINLKY